MHRRTNPKTYSIARDLRQNQTEAEIMLWEALRNHSFVGIHFRRQHAINRYVVDFCAPRMKLIIEVDGAPHLEQQEYDAERTAFLESKGYLVLRFWNSEVINNIKLYSKGFTMWSIQKSKRWEMMPGLCFDNGWLCPIDCSRLALGQKPDQNKLYNRVTDPLPTSPKMNNSILKGGFRQAQPALFL